MKEMTKEFIQEFLPPVDSKRKYDSNTAMSIVISMNRIFKAYLGKEVSKDLILDSFEELGYNFMFANFEYDYDKKRAYIRPNGTTRIVEGFGRDSEEKYYINISPPDLNALRKATRKMPPNTSPEKLVENQRLIESLKKFFLRFKISETS